MKKLFSIIRMLLAALAVSSFPLYAQAQSPACPPEAEQRLYSMIENIRLKQQKDGAEVAALANWAVTTCPKRRDVQSMASTLHSVLARSSNDLEIVSEYVSQIHLALQQEYAARSPNDKPSKVLKKDGSTLTYFAHNQSGNVGPKIMLPLLVALGERGKIHPLVSGAPLDVCPYPKAFESSLVDEGEFWMDHTEKKYEQPVFTWAANRLRSLRDACPEHAYELNYYLARHYGNPVYHLTDFEKSHAGMGMFGQDMYQYKMRADGMTYTVESSFNTARAKFAAQARPLAEPLRGYIAAYEVAAEAERVRSERDDSFRHRQYLEKTRNPRNAEVKKWKKAAEDLAAYTPQ